MLALRPIVAFLSFVVVPLVAFYLAWSKRDPISMGVAFAMVILAATLARPIVIEPLIALSWWRRFARDNDYEFYGTLSREPIVRGEAHGTRFVAGLSVMLAPRGSRERYRTVVSVPVETGVPRGFRLHRRDASVWLNERSGKNEVGLGVRLLDALLCEGHSAEAARKFTKGTQRIEALQAFFERYPSGIVHGPDLPGVPAEPGGASGVITVALGGRVHDRDAISECIRDAGRLANVLESDDA